MNGAPDSTPWLTVGTDARVSRALVRACAAFSIRPTAVIADTNAAAADPGDVLRALADLPPGGIALIGGPSGSGKSTLLRRFTARIPGNAFVTHASTHAAFASGEGREPLDRRSIIDCFRDPRSAPGLLARVGLAEPRLFPRRAGELSVGERARLAVALAFERATNAHEPDRWIIADEFGAPLDRLTACSVAAAVTRLVRGRGASAGVRLIAATAHDDMQQMLGTDLRLYCEPAAGVAIERGPVTPRGPRVTIEPGTIADFDRLAHHHYRAGRPATATGVLRAVLRSRVVGVAVISMPTLNGRWRQLAWPGRYARPPIRRSLRRMNRELRCISRVVIDPRCRGLGLATRLVRTYLDNPQTPATEAVAAMGAVCPFFGRAGMTAYPLPRHAADLRLADALEHLGVPAWRLLAEPSAFTSRAAVRSAVAAWAAARRVRDRDRLQPESLAARAAIRVLSDPIAFAHTSEKA